MSSNIRYTGRIVGEIAGTVIGEPIKFVGKQLNSGLLTEIGDGVKNASTVAGDTTGQFIDGAWGVASGIYHKDDQQKNAGLTNIWDSSIKTTKGVVQTVITTSQQGLEVVTGLIDGDKAKITSGARGIVKTAAIATLAIGTLDLLNGDEVSADTNLSVEQELQEGHSVTSENSSNDYIEIVESQEDAASSTYIEGNQIEMIETINNSLEGQLHPITDVPFERDIVHLPNGETNSGVFPDFTETYSTYLTDNMYLMSDDAQFQFATNQLASEIQHNNVLRAEFTIDQLAQIEAGETPDGYVWHHHQQLGRLELIDEQTHTLTGHSGGRYLWGGGSDYR